MVRRCSLQVVVPFKQKEAHLVGKSLALAGIIMMKMVFDQLVKRISTALPITLIKMVSCKLAGPSLIVIGTILLVPEL